MTLLNSCSIIDVHAYPDVYAYHAYPTSNLVLILYKSHQWVKLQLCQDTWPSTPNNVEEHGYRNLQSSVPHFKSNEVLLFCQDHLMFELYLFLGYWGIRATSGTKVETPLNQVQKKFSTHYFTSNQTLCQCLGHLWVGLYLFHRY